MTFEPERPLQLSRAERLTVSFYDWERRGRGWQVWPQPVDLEPPFLPFYGHGVQASVPALDDGRRSTVLSAVVDRVRAWVGGGGRRPPRVAADEIAEPEPAAVGTAAPPIVVQVTIPSTLVVTAEATEQLLRGLGSLPGPMSFELVGTADSIVVQIVCPAVTQTRVQEVLTAYFPDVVARIDDDALAASWGVPGLTNALVADHGLAHEFMLPTRCYHRFDVDPLAGIAAALSNLESEEVGVMQVLLQSVTQPWAESALRAIADGSGGAFFADAPETLTLAREKMSRPLSAVVVRTAAKSPDADRPWSIVGALSAALNQFARPMSNELLPLSNHGYDNARHEEDLLLRRSRRSGMLLNLAELASIAHLPSPAVRAPKLVRANKKTKAAPAAAYGHALVLGENEHAGETVEVGLSGTQRLRHTYVVGASGTGKSTLLLNMVVQDMRNGEGVGVLDPHGDLIDEILGHVPDERLGDVVLLDPADREFAVGLNLLSAHSDLEKQLLSSDLVAVFRRLSTSWGDQMTSVLGNAVLAFLESDTGGTLADLRRFLVEPEFRRAFLRSVTDDEVVYFWQKEFPLLSGKPQAPLLTRLDAFLRPRLIRHMVVQRENRIDFAGIMNGRKIFLAKLAQGAIGEENAYLLGALLVSKIHQIAQSRQELPESERVSFYLYIDEFHHFLTPSTAAILAGARKYGLGLILAHQDLSQLGRRETGVLGAAMSNPATRVCFRVGDMDARRLQDGFSFFGASELQSLGVGEAICRIEQAQHDFNLRTYVPPDVDGDVAAERRKKIVELCRKRYATSREDVERAMRHGRTRTGQRENESRDQKPRAAVRTQTPKREPEAAAEVKPAATGPTPLRTIKPSPGKGGEQHKYLQGLIKRWAESRGWKASIERAILDGHGSVDVALEKGAIAIACEVSVTTGPEHEVGNVQKCLAAGYEHVVVVSVERPHLNRVRKKTADVLSEDEFAKIGFLVPEELFVFLEERDVPMDSESDVKGYKVKVEYQGLPREEKQARMKAISKVLRDALKRLRRPD